MPKVASKSPKSSAKLHPTPPFSKEYAKYVDIDFSRKGIKWSNIFSLLLLLVIGSIGTLIFSLINNTNNNDNDNDNDNDKDDI